MYTTEAKQTAFPTNGKYIAKRNNKDFKEFGKRKACKEGNFTLCPTNNNFLNYKFDLIPDNSSAKEIAKGVNQKENINYLYKIVKHYKSLDGQNIETSISGNFLTDLLNLYYELWDLFQSKGFDVNFEYDEEKEQFYFLLYREHCMSWTKFYHLPIKNFEHFPVPMQVWFKKFIKYYSKRQKISLLPSHPFYGDYIDGFIKEQLEEYKNNICDESSDLYYKKYKACAEMYKHVAEVFSEIENLPMPSKELLIEEGKMLLTSSYSLIDKKIISLILDFVNLLSTDCLMDYNYDSRCSEEFFYYGENEVFPMKDLFTVIWDSEDLIAQEVEQWMNDDIGNYRTYLPTSRVDLSLNSVVIPVCSDFPERFYYYYLKLENYLFDYYELINKNFN